MALHIPRPTSRLQQPRKPRPCRAGSNISVLRPFGLVKYAQYPHWRVMRLIAPTLTRFCCRYHDSTGTRIELEQAGIPRGSERWISTQCQTVGDAVVECAKLCNLWTIRLMIFAFSPALGLLQHSLGHDPDSCYSKQPGSFGWSFS
jgi:hypothetical protein